ncbi:MAG: toxin-antitoxin system protein [Peptococcaceae bacterium]|nr:toxin-antitoxin system protein [Peptococcaceae bacterium]
MSGTTIRVSHTSWKTLREIADRAGESLQSVLDKAIEEYRRKCFLEEANKAFAALKNNPAEWEAELKERASWDIALNDGLRKEE